MKKKALLPCNKRIKSMYKKGTDLIPGTLTGIFSSSYCPFLKISFFTKLRYVNIKKNTLPL